MFFTCLVFIGSVLGAVSAGGELTQADKDFILDLHNTERTKEGAANMNKLSWSDDLEKKATAWVKKCVFAHQQERTWGENIGMTMGMTKKENKDKIEILVTEGLKSFPSFKSWMQEKTNEKTSDFTCPNCGHYYQMVRASTKKLGCAAFDCPNKKWFLACYYRPQGYGAVFISGKACSKCEDGLKCDNGLCVG